MRQIASTARLIELIAPHAFPHRGSAAFWVLVVTSAPVVDSAAAPAPADDVVGVVGPTELAPLSCARARSS